MVQPNRWSPTSGDAIAGTIAASMRAGPLWRVVSDDVRLSDTRLAFDGVAGEYDGPAGNNSVIQRMRDRMWRTLTDTFPVGSRLLDLGCGTGIDAAYLAGRGYSVLATDWSPAMVERTRARFREQRLEQRGSARVLGIHELDQLRGEQFDGIYSDLGPLNCVPDLADTARACAALLQPGGRMVASVIGRVCPWEMAYYAVHAQIGAERCCAGSRMRWRCRWREERCGRGTTHHAASTSPSPKPLI